MQPHATLIRAKGEGEALAQIQATGRVEVKAAYSPLNHLLVMAAATGRPSLPTRKDRQQDNYRTLQYEFGVGTYLPLNPNWNIQLAAGTGQAYVERTVSEFGIILAFSNAYEARYRRNFGQLGVAYQKGWAGMGFGYQLTQAVFSQLSAQDRSGNQTRYELPLENQLRHELYGFIRYGLDGPVAQSHWQLQTSVAYSFCEPGRSTPEPYSDIAYRAQFNRGSGLLIGLGVVYALRPR
ncbi:hypothetical protein GCM10023186_01570 [Hymenobacter koreensis]|uniref:DUF3575 domain-containing protein n=2 Tax=Hymenobacter koreensis TaxID=1084523 RepID=A0ABP8IU03_9BACT